MNKFFKIVLLGILSLSLFTTGCDKKEDKKVEDEVKVNTNINVIKDQEVDGFSMTNTSLIYENGESFFSVDATNNTGSEVTLKEFKIYVKDSDDKTMVVLSRDVSGTVQAGETIVLEPSVNMDLSDAASVEYVLVK